MAKNKTIRVVTRAPDGKIRERDFEAFEQLDELHDRVGIDDCSTDLSLRGMPVYRGLIGPMPETKTIVRYESPEIFEAMTKEWSKAKAKRRRRRSSEEVARDGKIPPPASPAFTSVVPPTMPTEI